MYSVSVKRELYHLAFCQDTFVKYHRQLWLGIACLVARALRVLSDALITAASPKYTVQQVTRCLSFEGIITFSFS